MIIGLLCHGMVRGNNFMSYYSFFLIGAFETIADGDNEFRLRQHDDSFVTSTAAGI